jgi:hypothetical protein
MSRFQTVIRRVRFAYSPYTATEMQGFAQVLADSIRTRIQSGQNIYDQASAPLKPGLPGRRGYPDYKAARGLNPIRDWTWSGHTLRCLKVLTANENRAAIGFLDESLPAAYLNRRRAMSFRQYCNAAASFVLLTSAVQVLPSASTNVKFASAPRIVLFLSSFTSENRNTNSAWPGFVYRIPWS